MTSSPKRHRYAGLLQHPPHGEREYTFGVAVAREPCEKIDSLSVLSEAWRQELWVSLSQIVPFEFGSLVDFTRQKATAQRAVRQGGDAVFTTPGNDVVQGLAFEKVERRLRGGKGCHAAEPFHRLDGVIGHSNRADLSGVLKVKQRLRGLFIWCGKIRPVDLIEIDIAGAQAFQRLIDLVQDLPSRRVAEKCVAMPFQAQLGSYDDPVTTAPLGDCSANDLLRVPESVRGSGVDQCYAEIQRRVDRPH